MRKDKYKIEMEDISPYQILRSEDFLAWEEVFPADMEKILDEMPEEKSKLFLGVVRNGSPFRFGKYYYKINSE